MKTRLAAALLTLGVAITPATALDPADRPEIEKIIREYLLANPQIMIEVQEALQVQQQAQAQARAAEEIGRASCRER